MSKTVKTRTQYRLVGSDYSAQEPRLTSHMAQDENMIQAYRDGKDLYCVIAANVFGNKYEENLEFWPEGTELELDGKTVISGSGNDYTKQVEDVLEVPYFYLIPTNTGDIQASNLTIDDIVICAEGQVAIAAISTENGITKIKFKN